MPKTTKKKQRGRPRGSKSKQAPIVEGVKTRCRSCGSTDRGHYFGRRVQEINGIDSITKEEYTHVVWQRTKCANCTQIRVDKHVENRK